MCRTGGSLLLPARGRLTPGRDDDALRRDRPYTTGEPAIFVTDTTVFRIRMVPGFFAGPDPSINKLMGYKDVVEEVL